MKSPALVCGLWIAVVMMAGLAASRSLQTVDEIRVAHPELPRATMRFHAAEFNRDLFRTSEWTQLALALAAGIVLLRRSSPHWVLGVFAVCVVILLFQRFYASGEITALGRQLDFALQPLPEVKARSGMMHGIYVSLEMVKLLGLVAIAAWTQKVSP